MNRSAFLRRLPALLLALALLATLAACRRAGAPDVGDFISYLHTEDAPPIDERTFPPVSAYPDEGDLGDYHVKIKDARQCEVTYAANLPADKAVLVTIDFTNNSRSPVSFEDALFDDAFQNGWETAPFFEEGYPDTEKTIVLDRSYDLTLARKDVRPGETLEVCRLYAAMAENPVEIFISERTLFDEQKVAKTFVINEAYPEMDIISATPNLGAYYIEIDKYGFHPYQNNDGENVFTIPINFQNFSKIPISFFDVMEIHAYQNKEELFFYERLMRNVGGEFYVKDSGRIGPAAYFKLNNTSDPVTITVSLKSDPSVSISETIDLSKQ